jgi:hypothetical protein
MPLARAAHGHGMHSRVTGNLQHSSSWHIGWPKAGRPCKTGLGGPLHGHANDHSTAVRTAAAGSRWCQIRHPGAKCNCRGKGHPALQSSLRTAHVMTAACCAAACMHVCACMHAHSQGITRGHTEAGAPSTIARGGLGLASATQWSQAIPAAAPVEPPHRPKLVQLCAEATMTRLNTQHKEGARQKE